MARQFGDWLAVDDCPQWGKLRHESLDALANGTVQIAIGTHALFQDDVAFADLGLAVVDEQHRFGVQQRMALSAKGNADKGGTDVLVMTATPIPRTLTLTAYGDMDVSPMPDKAAGPPTGRYAGHINGPL